MPFVLCMLSNRCGKSITLYRPFYGQSAKHKMTTAHPRWFTPLRLLGIFCLTNLVVYLDRGLIASNGVNGSPRTEDDPDGSGIQGEFNLSYFQDGLLPALFMVGLLLSSPVFAEAVKHSSAFRLLGGGMGVWSAAVVGCGLAPNFGCLLAARAFVGVGEASFVALAAPFIDDFAPPAQKVRWFSAFYLCIPVGFALGYIFGGVITAVASWRVAFLLEGGAMFPFVIFALTAAPIALRGSKPTTDEHDSPNESPRVTDNGSATATVDGGDGDDNNPHPNQPPTHHHHQHHACRRTVRAILTEFTVDVGTVCRQRVWVAVCGAYTAYVAVLGVYAYWGPQAGRALFFGSGAGERGGGGGGKADLVFGGVTVLTGVLGSVAGGLALDRLGSSLRTANLLCAVSCIAGFCWLLPAFTASSSFTSFMALFAVGQLLIFLLQAPVAAVGMWSVPTELRPLGASLMTVSIHLLGDVPSPPLVGLLQTRLAAGKDPATAAQQWRISLSVCSCLLLVSGALFAVAAGLSVPGTDYRGRGGEGRGGEGGGPGEGEAEGEGEVDVRPLLAEEGSLIGSLRGGGEGAGTGKR